MATTSGDAIRHLWTHKTQDHPWLADEDLVIERAEGVWCGPSAARSCIDGLRRPRRGQRRSTGGGRSPRPIAEQTVRPGVLSDRRAVLESPRRRAGGEGRSLAPGDLDYSFFAVSGAEANERADADGPPLLARPGKPKKHKVHLAPGWLSRRRHDRHLSPVCGPASHVEPYTTLHVPGFAKVTPPYPYP
jgi:hypothetical protein